MAEIGISIVAKVAEYLVQPVVRQGQYLFCVNKFLKDLENKKKELVSKQDSVLIQVEEAKRKTERIEDDVQKWLNDVQHLLVEVENLEQEVKAKNSCFKGGCPTWGRYLLCKQMVEKSKEMIELNNRRNFDRFAQLATLPGIEYSAIEDFTFFKATKLAYDQLLEALQDDGISRVGLYGMGGSGKTTLVTEVGKEAKKLNLFDQVVEITVSQTPDIRKIQGRMADMLNIRLEEETDEGRAQRLYLKLKGEKRILIIVDDVWGEFNLKDIGIASDICSCKVILTTRRQHVCCLMDCQKKIQLELLNEDEAWDLLKKHACIYDQYSLHSVAQNVARECKGLPIAIQAVGRSLKKQSINEWEVALENLRSSKPIDVEDGQRDAFSCLKLSYDYLKNENHKLLFLMCCIFPEDHEFSVEYLIKCGVGIGICGEYQSFESARKRVKVGINKLVDSCLLMHFRTQFHEEFFRMHDLIRDLGLWIASNEERTSMVNLSNDLKSLIGDVAIKDHFAISSWNTMQISNQLVAAKLQILWICVEGSLDLSSASFHGLQGLKVMVLKNDFSAIWTYWGDLSLPPSMESLNNLRTLCLEGWKLGDISFVIRLTRLEILELKCCSINKLPDGITNLNKLKLLDLSKCVVLDNYESSVQLSQIEELYVSGAWGEGRWICPSPSFVDNITATNLQRYMLDFSKTYNTYNEFLLESTVRALRLPSINISSISASMRNLLQRAEHVSFVDLEGDCQNIIPNVVRAVGGMNDLAMLELISCIETECVLDTTSHQVDDELPVLVKLYLEGMENLKEVCRGPPLLGFFEKLQELRVTSCPQLHNVFPRECKLLNLRILYIKSVRIAALFSISVARSLSQLESLHISYISELKLIITEEEGDGTNTGEEIIPASHSSHLIFPNLKTLHVDSCDELEYILPISCVEGLQKLKSIGITSSGNSKLKYVFGEYDQRDHSSREKSIQIPLPKLRDLTLYDLENLHSICPEKYHLRCPSLKILHVSNCQKLTKLCIMISTEVGQLPLENDLSELKSTRTTPTPTQILSLQHLHRLCVHRCHNLKFLFSLVVSNKYEELEEIVEENEGLKDLSNAQVCFPKLKMIDIGYCKMLKSVFPVALARQEIVVAKLEELQLTKLPSFVGISTRLMLTALNIAGMVIIDDCPKFAPMIEASKAIPHLGITKGSQASTSNDREVTSKEQEKNVMWRVEWMYLKHFQYLKCIGEELTLVSLENLIHLRLSGCRKLKFIFYANVTLPQLKYFSVENCEELMEIISEYPDQAQERGSSHTSKAHFQEVCFPKLVYLWIWRCSKLKSVFSISMVKHLPELGHMDITKCSQLEQLFCCPCEANGGDGVVMEMKVLLPKLKGMILRGLPSLIHICRDSHQLQLPALKHFIVMDCPNFSLTTYAAFESFRCPLEGYIKDLSKQMEKEVDYILYRNFLKISYDSEHEKAAEKKKKNIIVKSKSYTYLRGELSIPYFERFSPTPIMECGFGHNLDADLLIKDTKMWDEAKVHVLYTKGAADVMLRNEVTESNKCAYFTCHNNGILNDSDLSDIHKKLENASLLQRHKFLWSAILRGVLPVKSQLKKIFKSEKYSTNCLLCSQASETVVHLFLGCSFVRSLWFSSPWGFRADHCSGLTMLEWFQFLTDSGELLLFASVMMDKVWDERNRIAHSSHSNPPDILRVAKSISATYFEMKNKLLPDIQEVADDIICRDGWFKAYFDVAMTEEESWAAALLLNHEGKLIGARARKLSTKFLLEQQALALELAVELACEVVPKSNICLEGGRERVIPILQDYLNHKMDYKVWYLEPILMGIRDKLGSIGDWENKSIFRNFNWHAYNAAKWTAFCNSEGDILNSVPAIELLSKNDFVSTFFTNDDDDEYDHDSLLNNSDNEDNDGPPRLKLKAVFTHDDGDNGNQK